MTALTEAQAAQTELHASSYWPKSRGTGNHLDLCDKHLTTCIAALQPVVQPAFLFFDDFIQPDGSPPDPSKWFNIDGIDYGGMSLSKAANAFINNNDLVLRITREAWHGKAFAGASVGSYQYQTGWPTPSAALKQSWPTPFRYETKFLLPNVQGAWVGPGWNQNIDRPTSQPIAELDCGETRTTFPTLFGANQHLWLNGSDTRPENAAGSGSDGRTNWHVMAVEARTTETKYYLDDTIIATHAGVSGKFGVQIHNQIADLGVWGSGGMQPNPNDPGPWDLRINYVKVTAL